MRDSRAPNPGNIPSQERHPRLLQRIVTFLRLPQKLIDLGHRRLEGRELDHRIRYLPSPQRIQALIQPGHSLLRRHLRPPFSQRTRVRRQRCLHPHLYRLEWAEGDVGEEFRGGGCAEVDEGLACIGEELFAVVVFEDFVEAIFAGALEGVADEGGGPAEEDAAETFFGEDAAPGREIGGVDVRVDLAAAFYLGREAVFSDFGLVMYVRGWGETGGRTNEIEGGNGCFGVSLWSIDCTLVDIRELYPQVNSYLYVWDHKI